MDDQETKLNELLEDALNDLLLDNEGTEEATELPEPKVAESLKKVKQVVTGGSGDVAVKSGSEGAKSKTHNKASNNKVGGGNCKASGSKDAQNQANNNCTNDASGLGFPDEEEMARFFEGMTAKLQSELPQIDPDEATAKINESMPQIFDMMQNLLSKELLYPALKDLSPKFEEWLKEKSATLSKADKKRYRKQKSIIDEIIYLFEDESIDDQERFEKNLDLMETMQSLGSPPEELTVPEGVGRCSIM